MFPPMELENEELYLRPMTCPHHFMLYKSELRSYRDLPIRYGEISPLFRKELSGSLYGLVRILQFHLADAHIFCTEEQIDAEFTQAIELIKIVMGSLGLSQRVSYRLSLRDASDEKFIADDEGWEFAESKLRSILDGIGLEYEEAPGDAAFYGPKLDVEIENIHGKLETIFTNQLDFALQKRFDLRYVDADGQRKHPYVIHRSSVGCIERTIAILTEHYRGAFPLWIAPVQAVVLPVTHESASFAATVREALADRSIRNELDDRDSKIGARIHEAGKQLVPYILIIGEKESAGRTVSVKNRDTGRQTTYPVDELVSALEEENRGRALSLSL
jgi:threonyl-tRNA synthetase